MGDFVLEFEPYEGQDLPVPQPWRVSESGSILNAHAKSIGMKFLRFEGLYPIVDLAGQEYIFPQKITNMRAV